MIIKMMDKRASTIDRGVEDARQAREQLDNAREEARKICGGGTGEAVGDTREAAKMKSDIIEGRLRREAAWSAARREMESARLAIDQARKEAELQFPQRSG